jgi:hypothetical protein
MLTHGVGPGRYAPRRRDRVVVSAAGNEQVGSRLSEEDNGRTHEHGQVREAAVSLTPSDPGAEGLGPGFDLDVAAATLAANSQDVHYLLKLLSRQLAPALGDRLVVQRAGGFLRKSDQVRSVRMIMGDEAFEAEVSGTSLICTIGRSSGGIRIRSERVGIDEWLRRLLAKLQAEATNSFSTRQALESIVLGGPF